MIALSSLVTALAFGDPQGKFYDVTLRHRIAVRKPEEKNI
jgi:hypothetical protein